MAEPGFWARVDNFTTENLRTRHAILVLLACALLVGAIAIFFPSLTAPYLTSDITQAFGVEIISGVYLSVLFVVVAHHWEQRRKYHEVQSRQDPKKLLIERLNTIDAEQKAIQAKLDTILQEQKLASTGAAVEE